MATQNILICIDEPQWTLEALHLASALALDTGWPIRLVKLVPVGGPTLLGQDGAYRQVTPAESREVQSYIATLQDYGVTYSLTLFQYLTRADAIVDVAGELDAPVVFATLPHSRLAWWRRFGLWTLRRQMAQQGRKLYTLENALEALVWSPPVPQEHAAAAHEPPG